MNQIPNRQAVCEVLIDKAKDDKDIIVLCSDSRGSASMTRFADDFPDQFVETGIAEQNLVSISAGLAKCGKKHLHAPQLVSYPQEATSRSRLMWHTPIQMLLLSVSAAVSATEPLE